MILPLNAVYRIVSVSNGKYRHTDYVGTKRECEYLAESFNRSVKGWDVKYTVVLSRLKPLDIVINGDD